MRDIRLSAARSQGWLKNDEQYRLRKASTPESSWGIVSQEFWLSYMTEIPFEKIFPIGPLENSRSTANHNQKTTKDTNRIQVIGIQPTKFRMQRTTNPNNCRTTLKPSNLASNGKRWRNFQDSLDTGIFNTLLGWIDFW